EEKPGRDDFGDQQQHAADHPQPARFQIVEHQPSILGTPGIPGAEPRPAVVSRFGFGAGRTAGACSPNTSRASSPMPPSVPINWVASTGNRIVLALGEGANLRSASTFF